MPYSGIFTITPEHINLLRNAVVRWEDCEFGAPAIDCKRPYGNSSVYEDMIEILGYDKASYVKEYLNKLHRETETVLQIFLYTGEMKTGKYVSERYGAVWKRIE
jgi:hypothetical protein